jgi:hypothetical protein
MTNNLIREWAEYSKLSELPALEELSFVGMVNFIIQQLSTTA